MPHLKVGAQKWTAITKQLTYAYINYYQIINIGHFGHWYIENPHHN